MAARTVADLGEFGLISVITAGLRGSDAVGVGPGDDAAVFTPSGDVAVSSDAMVEDVHFTRAWFSPEDIGHKALAVNLSDLAACGAEPLAFSLALAMPRADDAFLAPFAQGLSRSGIDERPAGAEGVHALGARPLVIGLLPVTGGDIVERGHTVQVIEGFVLRDIAAALTDDQGDFTLVINALRSGRPYDPAAMGDQAAGRFEKQQRPLVRRGIAHLRRVRAVVAADADDLGRHHRRQRGHGGGVILGAGTLDIEPVVAHPHRAVHDPVVILAVIPGLAGAVSVDAHGNSIADGRWLFDRFEPHFP